MDRETDKQKAKHRDEGILTGREQIQNKIISYSGFQQQQKMYKRCKISASNKRHKNLVLYQSEGWESEQDFVKVPK